jgi:hypothetical protein
MRAAAIAIALTLGVGGVEKVLAQELDPKWVVGQWTGTLQAGGTSGVAPASDLELLMNEDGTFKCSFRATQGGQSGWNSRWVLADGKLSLDGTFDTGQAAGKRATAGLFRRGEGLSGSLFSYWSQVTREVSFTRKK